MSFLCIALRRFAARRNSFAPKKVLNRDNCETKRYMKNDINSFLMIVFAVLRWFKPLRVFMCYFKIYFKYKLNAVSFGLCNISFFKLRIRSLLLVQNNHCVDAPYSQSL